MRTMSNASNKVLTHAADVPVGGGRLRVPVAAVSTAGLLALYLALGAKALNLDGLGYAGRVQSGDQLLLPGHLFYAPIMYALYRFVAPFAPGADAARVMQACGAVFAAAGVGVFISALRRLSVGTFTAVTTGLALAFSYTYWVHATDLTTYAFSSFCLICAFHLLCSARSSGKGANVWAVGGMVALATLIHQSNLVFLPAAVLGIGVSGTGSRNALKLAAISLALICLPYAILGWVATGSRSPAVIGRWAAVGAHGYAPGFTPVNLARGVYGFANAVIYLDDAGTAIKGHIARVSGSGLSSRDMLRLASKAGFVVVLVGMPCAAYLRRRKLTDKHRWAVRVCAAWIVPYTGVALLFFTTDHDRWIMLLPAVATLAAVAFPKPLPRGKIAGVGAVAILFALNLTSAIYPAHLGANNRYYQEAIRLAPCLAATDLVIFWGHDHIGTAGYLRRLKRVEAMHVIDLVLKRGKPDGLRELTVMAGNAMVAHRRVLVVGLYGARDRAADYLSEAHALGLTRADVLRALVPFTAQPVHTVSEDAPLLFPTPYSLSPVPGGSAP